MIHELKTVQPYFDAVWNGIKTFEIRRNDRGFKVGDVLDLKEWDGEKFTGKTATRTVAYLTDFEQKPGYVVLGWNATIMPTPPPTPITHQMVDRAERWLCGHDAWELPYGSTGSGEAARTILEAALADPPVRGSADGMIEPGPPKVDVEQATELAASWGLTTGDKAKHILTALKGGAK